MVKIFIVYDTKYGNTKLVAEKIMEGMKEVKGIETVITSAKEADFERMADSHAILIGAPNHMGRPTRVIRKLIDKLGKLDLKGEWVAVFDTYLGGDFEKAVKKMEGRIDEKVPNLKIITSGLSIKVGGIKGPIVEKDLPKCKEFGKKIANQLRGVKDAK